MRIHRMLVRTGALMLCATGLLGCQVLGALDDPLGRRFALETAQRKYTQAVRWGEIEEASRFVAPELRSAFLEKAELFDDFRITDYQIGNIDYEEDGDAANVRVTYRGYSMASFLERPVKERQAWVRETGNEWRVRPDFDAPFGPISQAEVR